MKYALIGDSQIDTQGLINNYGGAYHLVLAQYMLRDRAYMTAYKLRHAQGHFIMLDNGAAELGQSISFEHVMHVADELLPDEIIMPDVLGDGEATAQATFNSLRKVNENYRAVVPQGRTWDEWEYCLKRLLMFGCRTICIAKRYERLPGGRAHALNLIQSMDAHRSHHIHLLGFNSEPLAEIRSALAAFSMVRGVDSAAPFAYAQDKKLIESPDRSSYQWDKPFCHSYAVANIRTIRNACMGDYKCT